MCTLTLNCPVWPWPLRYGPGSRSLHIVSIRIFISSYMVNHQCISKLKPRHEMSQTDIRTDERTDILTDEVYSYNPLQLYERGLKRISVYVNLKELPKSILRSNDLQGVQLDTKAGCVMGWAMCCSNDHKSNLNRGQIHDVKYPKYKYYTFESTLNTKRLCVKIFKLRGAWIVL